VERTIVRACIVIGAFAVVVAAAVQWAPRGLGRPPLPANVEGAIAGVVRDSNGRPISAASVTVLVGVSPLQATATDSQGMYQVTGLPVGQYVVRVQAQGFVGLAFGQVRMWDPIGLVKVEPSQVSDAPFQLSPSATILGFVSREDGQAIEGARIQLYRRVVSHGHPTLLSAHEHLALGLSAADGAFEITGIEPGDYFVRCVKGDAFPSRNAPSRRAAFAPAFFPNALDEKDAVEARLEPRQRLRVDFRLSSLDLVLVAGAVVNSQGLPPGSAYVRLQKVDSLLDTGKVAPVRADGSFEIQALPLPGTYSLAAMVGRRSDGKTSEFAESLIEINELDHKVALRTEPLPTISGIVDMSSVVDRAGRASLSVAARSFNPRHRWKDGPSVPVDSDGRFSIEVLTPSVLTVQETVYRQVVQHLAKDVTFGPLEPGAANVLVQFDGRLGSLEGRVLGLKGRPSGVVLALNTNGDLWRDPFERYLGTALVSASGAFRIGGMLPGNYRVVWVPSFDVSEKTSENTLGMLSRAGMEVSLEPNSRVVVSVDGRR
jgi:hypothetical protein